MAVAMPAAAGGPTRRAPRPAVLVPSATAHLPHLLHQLLLQEQRLLLEHRVLLLPLRLLLQCRALRVVLRAPGPASTAASAGLRPQLLRLQLLLELLLHARARMLLLQHRSLPVLLRRPRRRSRPRHATHPEPVPLRALRRLLLLLHVAEMRLAGMLLLQVRGLLRSAATPRRTAPRPKKPATTAVNTRARRRLPFRPAPCTREKHPSGVVPAAVPARPSARIRREILVAVRGLHCGPRSQPLLLL